MSAKRRRVIVEALGTSPTTVYLVTGHKYRAAVDTPASIPGFLVKTGLQAKGWKDVSVYTSRPKGWDKQREAGNYWISAIWTGATGDIEPPPGVTVNDLQDMSSMPGKDGKMASEGNTNWPLVLGVGFIIWQLTR